MDIERLVPLAKAVASAGFPVLATILGSVLPFPGNLVAKTVLTGIANAVGTSPDDPEATAEAVSKDGVPGGAVSPELSEKLQAIQSEAQNALDFAKLQVDQNQAELATGNLFLSGWRPAFAWSCVVMVWYQVVQLAMGYHHPIPVELFDPIWAAFGGLLGLRSVEKWLGVAPAVDKIKVIPETIKRVFKRKK